MKRYAKLLFKYVGPMRWKAVGLAVLFLINIGLQLGNPLIVRHFIDTLINGGSSQAMFLIALAFFGISLLIQIASVVSVYIGEDIGWRTTNQLRSDLINHCIRLDMSFHTAHTPGEMIERIDGDVLALANFFSRFLITILGNVILVIGIILILGFIDIRIAAVILVYLVVGLGAMIGLRRIGVSSWKASRQTSADVFAALEEHLSGIEDIRSSGAIAYVIRQLLKLNLKRLDADIKSSMANVGIVASWIGMYITGQIVAFILGYTLFRAGVLTFGAVFLVVYFTNLVSQRLQEITGEVQNLQQAIASLERVEALLSTENRIIKPANPCYLPAGPLAVDFDGVTFGYSEQTPVLEQITFHLQPNKKLGLLGRTGSGKTTLSRILFRLYDPLAGTIRLGGTNGNCGASGDMLDLCSIELNHLRQRIGMVTQTVQLFQASVRDNVSFFDTSIPDEKIRQVLAALELSDWYQSLPGGLDTMLESGGIQLSAGETQLLAFARVFLADPGLVILDEASSLLDPLTEKRVEHAMQKLLENRTAIIIAHRLATVQQADQILIIEKGQMQEFGERSALAQDQNSRFYRLLQTGLEEVLA